MLTDAKRKLIEEALRGKARRKTSGAKAELTDEMKALILESINDRVRRGIEDADYACCAHVDLALVRTVKELTPWLEEYRPLVSRKVLERIQQLTCMGVAV